MAADQFKLAEKIRVVNAIKQAELNTSGEIRVHIEDRCKGNVLDRASDVFAMLKMHKTALRNSVLFYLALKDHQFAILGDAGINALVPDNFWESTKEAMLQHFKDGNFAEGLAVGITMAGDKLKEHFPYQKDDVNELPNDISFGS
jgi:uncharacterized membrane protein